MTAPFNFANNDRLPPSLATLMQSVADSRAARGLISDDGQTHKSIAHKDVYDAGHGVLSKAYRDAG